MSEPLAIERSKAVICRNLFNDPSELLRIDRFELVRTLGRGGMGVVYEALDSLRGERVALKMLNGQGAADLYRLKREFRALAELTHPNLVVLHELTIAPQHAFFTLELVSGGDIVSYIRRGAPQLGPPPDAARLRSALAQLGEGIRALHMGGKLHRDLKPSNVLVTESGRVVLLDFGLVQDLRERTGEIEGTPAYMAPEQRRGRACESSDWYAFGRILQQALHGDPELALRRSGARAGGELAQLATRLLDDEPERRPGWQEIMAVVAGVPHAARAAAQRLSRASEPRSARACESFVGRTQELASLQQAFTRSKRGPVLALLRGESGIGKTALMGRFASSNLNASGAMVLSSRCYEREFIPFKALDSAIDELSRHLSTAPREQLAKLSADDVRALLHLFPVLGRVQWLAEQAAAGEDVHPVVQRRRGFDALKKVLGTLVAERPLVLCIDDLQWSDADSGVLLSVLLCDRDAPPLLVVASDRADPGRLNPALEELYRAAEDSAAQPTIVELTLGALPAGEAATLARSLLAVEGSTNRAMPELIAAESRGNPLFLKELSRWAAAAPVGFDGGTSIDAIVGSRVRTLSSAARAALELLAIAGRPLPSAVIAQALDLPTDLHRPVLELRRTRLAHVVRREDAELLELEHDRIGEAVRRTLEPGRRHDLHARLAWALDADELHVEAAVAQYIAAQLPEEAAQRARQAGYLALGALAFARAAWLFRQALELGRWPDATRAHLFGELALALEHSGRGLEAAEAYRSAAALTEDRLEAVKLEARAAEHLAHNGRCDEGFALLQRCFASLGMPWPRGRLALLFALLKLLLVLQLRKPAPRPQSAEAARLSRARLFPEAVSAVEGYDPLRALYNGLLGLREAEALGDAVYSARALGARGLLRCLSVLWGGVSRGLQDLEAACALAEQLGDPAALAELQLQLALGHIVNGQPHQTLVWANRCEANMRLMPLPPRALYRVMGLIVNALHDLGELREAHRRWSAFAHEASHHGDVVTSFWTHAHPLHMSTLFAAHDRAGVDAALEKHARLRRKHPEYFLVVWSHAACRVETELYWGRPSEAERMVALEWSVLSQTSYKIFEGLARLLRARVAVAAAAHLPWGMRRVWLLCRAWLDARDLDSPKHGFTLAAEPILRASMALLWGRREHARRQLKIGIAMLDGSGCKLTAASARYCLGALLPDRSEGRALQAAASAVLVGEGIVNPRSWVAWTLPGFRKLLEFSDG
jgi:serine/threonine protein kinase